MGYPHPETSASLVPRGVGAELQPARRPKDGWVAATRSERANRIIGVVLAFMLAVTMLPVAGLASAFADEPVERPATSGGDMALESANGDASAGAPQAPVAEAREDGMLAAGGLTYTVADGGLSLVGFDDAVPEGALAVPAAVMVDDKKTPVVAVDVAEGQVADQVVVLSLPQGIKNINTGSLAAAFPNLLSVEVAAAGSSLPVASGAASMRAAYSTSGGMIFRPANVAVQTEDGLVESIECKELVWAPPALVSARIPVECRAVAEGAFADVRDLRTVVAFGTMERIAKDAFSTEQMESAKVVVPQASAATTPEGAERVSASMALMGDAGQKERRSAWHEAGWRTDDIVMGKPYGSLTETVAVTDEGTIERTEMQLVSYPGAHENAMDLKKPNAEGVIEQAESGLAFTVKSDMTASVTWQGDKTATPSHVEIPASVVIDGVTYPVTEIAPNAFEGAAFLTSVSFPEGVTAIGQDAFKDCPNLTETIFPSTLRLGGSGGSRENPASLPVSYDDHSDSAFTARPPAAVGIPDASESVSSLDLDASSTASDESGLSGYASYNGLSLEIYASTGKWSDALSLTGFKDCSISDSDFLKVSASVPSCIGVVWRVSAAYFSRAAKIHFSFADSSGSSLASFDLTVRTGYTLVGVSSADTNFFRDNSPTSFGAADSIFVHVVRSEAVGTSQLATTSLLSKSGETAFSATNTVRGAINDVSSKLSKSGETGFSSTNTVRGAINAKADSTVLSKTANKYTKDSTVEMAIETKVSASEFGTISYGSSLDGVRDKSVYPTSYRKGGTPAIPEPEKAGQAFEGWSWSRVNAVGGQTVTGDSGNIQSAFAEPGTVTLTARWGTPEADHFFSGGRPLDAAGGAQSHVIKVKLADSQKAVSNLHFKPKDTTGLIKPDAQGGVSFSAGVSEGADAGTCGWDGTIAGPIQLADLGDGAWGLYVKVSIPDGAVDQSKVVKSFTGGEYVASLVTLEYSFA